MENDAPVVFVIVVSYNGAAWVERCFGSLRKSAHPVQTILVDNHSTDSTVSDVRRRFPEVHIIANAANAGFGKANNQGIAFALARGANVFFLLNQDAWIEPDTIASMLMVLPSFPQAGIFSPMHYTGSGNALDYNFERYLLRDARPEAVRQWTGATIPQGHPVSFVNAAAWMIPKHCLEKIGGFGPLFFHYGEDHDFVQRMNYFGLSTVVVTATKIFHDREHRSPDTLRSTPAKLFRYYFIGTLVRLADIRSAFILRLAWIVYWNLREATALLLKGRWIAPFTALVVLSRSIGKIPSVLRYRAEVSGNYRYRFLNGN